MDAYSGAVIYPISAGGIIKYTYTVSNGGLVTLTGIVVNDSKGYNVNIGTLAPGASQTVTYDYTISQAQLDLGSITSMATVVLGSNTYTKSTTVTINQSPSIDLTKTASPQGYNVGSIINYTFVITNNGNVTLTNINLVDALLGLNVTVPSLAPGAINTQNNSHIITQAEFDAFIITNTATVTATGPLGQSVSDSSTISTNFLPYLDWVRQQPSFNTSASDAVPDITVDLNQNVYVAYQSFGTASGQVSSGLSDIIVFKMDRYGNVIWIRQQPSFNTNSYDQSKINIGVDNSYNVYVSYLVYNGTASGQVSTAGRDIVVFKLDTNGNTQWVRQQPSFNSPGTNQSPSSVVDPNGNVYLTFENLEYSYFDITVCKIDTNGTVIWCYKHPTFNTADNDTKSSIDIDDNNNIYVAYATSSTTSGQINSGNRDIAVVKMDNDGNIIWIRQQPSFNTSVEDLYPEISVDPSGNSYVAYYTLGTASGQANTGSNDIIVFKLDTNGNTLWVQQQPTFNTVNNDQTPSIDTDADGNSYITYWTDGKASGQTSMGGYDIVVFKLNTSGQLQWVAQQAQFNTSGDDRSPRIALDRNRNIYVTYWTYGGTVSGQINAGGPQDIVVFKLGTQTASIDLTKSASPQDLNVGGIIDYTLVITNNGNVTLTNVHLIDTLLGINVTIPSLAPTATNTQIGSHLITQADFDAHVVTNTATVSADGPQISVSDSASTTTTLTAQNPSIIFTKTALPQGLNVGNIINYTMVITNNGNATLMSVHLVDTFLGINITLPSLAPSVTNIQYGSHVITQAEFDAHSVTNTATVSAMGPQEQPVSDSDSTTTTLGTQNPSINLTKSAFPQGLNVGSIINYTLVITNNGNVTLTSIHLVDGLLGLNVTIPSLAPAASNTQTGSHVITLADFIAHSITNTATVSAIGPQQQSVSDSDTIIVTLGEQNPSINLTKTASPQGFDVGDIIDYTLVITNNGNVPLTDVHLVDTLLGINIVIQYLESDETYTFTGSHMITQADFNALGVVNTATVSAKGPLQQSVSDTDVTITTLGIQTASIDLKKTASPQGINVGDTINYTLVITNNGNVPLTSVHLVDPLINLDMTFPSLPLLGTITQLGSHIITQSEFDTHSLTNTATVTATDPDQQPVSDSASTTTVLGTQSSLIDLSKSAFPQGINVGDQINYNLVITNTGNVTLSNVHLVDALINLDVTIPVLIPLATSTQSGIHTITQTEFDAHNVVNNATVTATNPQQLPVSDSVSIITTLDTQLPSIDLVKTATPTGLNVGNQINYTLVITNTGNVTLTNVHLVDAFLNLNMTIPSLAPLAIITQLVGHIITQVDFDAHSITNIANVTGTGPQQQSVSDSATTTTTLGTQLPSIDLVKTASPQGVNAGGKIKYTLVITNTGNVTLTNVHLVDALLNLNITIPSMVPASTNTQTSRHTITQSEFDAHNVVNTATVSATDPQQQLVSDSASTTTTLGAQISSIELTKSASPQGLNVGNQINYTLIITNTGNVTLTNVHLLDTFLNIDVTIPSLAPLATSTHHDSHTITQTDFDTHNVINNATVTATDPGQLSVSDSASTTTILGTQSPSIKLSKTAFPEGINVGDQINYTLVITNTGNVTLTNIHLVDVLLNLNVTIPSLIPSANSTKTSSHIITQAEFNARSVINIATVTATSPQQQSVSDSVTVTTSLIIPLPSINLSKSASPQGLNVGNQINYTLITTNTGNITLTNIHLVDLLLGIDLIIDSLDPSESRTENQTYFITQNDFDRHTITNTSQVTGTTSNQDQVSDQAEVITVLGEQIPSIMITKTATPHGISVGGIIEYTLMITNNGNVSLHDVVLTDILLNLEVTRDLLGPSESFVELSIYQITQADFDQHMITNTAQVTALTPSQQKITNQSTVTTTLGDILPALTLTKVGQPSGLNTGDFIEYTLITTNTGNVTLHDLQLVDTILGLDIDWPTLAPTESHTEVHQYQITQEDFDQHTITNTAQVTASYYLVNQSNQQIIQNIYGPGVKGRQAYLKNAIDNWLQIHKESRTKMLKDTVQLNITAEAEFTITLGDQNPSINLVKTTKSIEQYVGGQIEYMITVTNDGNVSLHAVHLTDPLINIDTTVDSLAPTDNHKETGTYIMTQDDFDHQLVTNVARVVALDPSDQEISMEVSVSTIPCVVRDTMIRMHDGTSKPIQEIIRGDVVAPGYRVARLCETEVNPKQVVELFVFQPDSLGQHQPDRELTITSNHPIIYAQGRRPARCFTNFKGVSTLIQNGITCLYDLQFDHDGSYFANNVEIQSRSPQSIMGPLPRHLYFDRSLYNEEYVWDSYDHPLKLIESKLRPAKIIRAKKENKIIKRKKI